MYSFEGRIRFSETGADGLLTPEKLIDYFQDCSTFQSEELGVGMEPLRRQGLAWVIVYWRVEIRRMPGLGERVRTGTIPYRLRGGVGLRNFFMDTAQGERLACANSVWSLMDMRQMRPVRIPEEITRAYEIGERLPMEYDARKIGIPAGEAVEHPPVTVKEYHLDANRHMNNGQYVRIATGLLPREKPISALRIEYRRQARLGDILVPFLYEEGGRATISLDAPDGGAWAVVEAAFQQ